MKTKIVTFCLLFFSASIVLGQGGVKKKRPLPHEYGQVVMDIYSTGAGMAPVIFDHWLHRAQFTCRLCHVDLGFSMKANTTGVTAADNMKGYYCGACHNGKMSHNNRTVFESCSKDLTVDQKRCDRCHSQDRYAKKDYYFYTYTEKFPKERFGNGIDWEKAESDGVIKLVDYLDWVSIKRRPLPMLKDFSIHPKVRGMPDIVFSHKKHTAWNGCELCHPDIFPSVKVGSRPYAMVEIFEGKFCGTCHTSVSFPLTDCQRCHTKLAQ